MNPGREMKVANVDNCGACRFWSPMQPPPRLQFLGICGQRDRAGGCTDRVDTCGDFEKKETEDAT